MNQTAQLIYPTLDLFLYDLGEGLGQSDEQIEENRRRFWERIYNHNLSEEKLVKLGEMEGNFSSYIELLGSQRFEYFKHPLDGYYYPIKLGDTYALQIDFGGKQNDPDWEQLSQWEQLRQLKEIVLEHTHDKTAEMGQSWLFWGQLATPEQNPEAIARASYQALEIVPQPTWERDYKGKGTFKGTTLFELERPDFTPDGFNRSYHVIICLFPHDQNKDEIKQTLDGLYLDFVQLFHYRHKILWVYEQSRQLKISLKQASGVIGKIVDSLSVRFGESYLNLNQLQEDLATALSISYLYETNLGSLQEQSSTVEINTDNYQNRVREMVEQDSNSGLAFLDEFGKLASSRYLTQIQSDCQSLNAGLKPLGNFIKTVEGIIEIEKTKNERTFNRTVAIASVGIGTATLAATTFTNSAQGIVDGIWPVQPNQSTPALNLWASSGLAFLLSLVIGLIGAGITWIALGKRKKKI